MGRGIRGVRGARGEVAVGAGLEGDGRNGLAAEIQEVCVGVAVTQKIVAVKEGVDGSLLGLFLACGLFQLAAAAFEEQATGGSHGDATGGQVDGRQAGLVFDGDTGANVGDGNAGIGLVKDESSARNERGVARGYQVVRTRRRSKTAGMRPGSQLPTSVQFFLSSQV